MLCGREEKGTVRVSHLLIPPQTGTYNTVEMLDDQFVASALVENSLVVVGWVHTHPTQSAFLSSIDVHTQYSYQALLKEAVAVVCAPSYGTVKWLRLTQAGMRVVGGCDMGGFHEHVSKSRLYQPALNIWFVQDKVCTLDLRTMVRRADEDAGAIRPAEGTLPSRLPDAVGTTDGAPGEDEGDEEEPIRAEGPSSVIERASPAPPVSSPSGGGTISSSKLRNMANKIAKTESHVHFLSTCIREQLLPKGFQLKWRSSYATDDATLKVIDKASQDLVKVCHRLAGKKLTSLKSDFERGWRDLASSLPARERDLLSGQLSRDRQRLDACLQRVKQGKVVYLREQRRLKRVNVGVVPCAAAEAGDCIGKMLDADRVGEDVGGEGTDGAGPTDGNVTGTGDVGSLVVDAVRGGVEGVGDCSGKRPGCDGPDGVSSKVDNSSGEPFGLVGAPLVVTGRTAGATDLPDPGCSLNGVGIAGDLVSDAGISLRVGSKKNVSYVAQHSSDNAEGVCNASSKSNENVKVTNLSSKALSDDQLSLLKKGLGFVPVKRHCVTQLISELKEWERLVRLREYWADSYQAQIGDDLAADSDSLQERDLKYKKSRWMPEKGRDPWLDMYVDEVTRSILDGVSKNRASNLSREEEQAVLDLLKDDSIIIRPADKGSGVVIMDTTDYFEGLKREVNDPSTYRSTEKDQTQLVHAKVKSLADKLLKKGYIGKHLHKYLIPSRPKPGYLQGNPKLHKEGHPLRVIVSGRGHATERIAELAEQELNTHVEGQMSFVRDTTDFINKIRDVKIPVTSDVEPLLFCMDVSKLYPSVPKKEGIAACREALDLRKDSSIPTDEVIEMINLVLDNNNFSVGNSNFTQINGTAIGSKLGRNYACTYLGKWEKALLASSDVKPFLYLRYIDDIFGIWLHGEKKLREFQALANGIHEKIKLDLRFSSKSIEFLDVRVSLKGDYLCTDVYAKPTDSKSYLHFSSDHPIYVKKAISVGLAMRAKRICSNDSDYLHQTRDIRKNLSSRGYPARYISQGLSRVRSMKRMDVLEKAAGGKDRRGVPLVVTYSAHLPNISNILKEKKSILARSERLKNIFSSNNDVFTSYKRGTNLRDILVHRKTKQIAEGRHKGQGDCGKNCSVCRVIFKDEDRIRGPNSSESCTYDRTIGCRSRNVIYGVFCEICRCVVYVGETGGVLYQRVQNHLSSIRCGRQEMEVAAHFSSDGHQLSNAKFVGLEKVWKGWTTYRRTREQRWVDLLNTHRRAGGLNKKTA